MWKARSFLTGTPEFGEEGQALVEYALILGLISVLAVAVLTTIGTDIVGLLNRVQSALASAV